MRRIRKPGGPDILSGLGSTDCQPPMSMQRYDYSFRLTIPIYPTLKDNHYSLQKTANNFVYNINLFIFAPWKEKTA